MVRNHRAIAQKHHLTIDACVCVNHGLLPDKLERPPHVAADSFRVERARVAVSPYGNRDDGICGQGYHTLPIVFGQAGRAIVDECADIREWCPCDSIPGRNGQGNGAAADSGRRGKGRRAARRSDNGAIDPSAKGWKAQTLSLFALYQTEQHSQALCLLTVTAIPIRQTVTVTG